MTLRRRYKDILVESADSGRLAHRDAEGGYCQGIGKFIDEKVYRPGAMHDG
jgi:hypothetical protein